MGTCIGCGGTLTKRSQRSYCSIACQQAARQAVAMALWLTTGTARASSQPDHYVRRHISREQDGRCAVCGIGAEWEGKALSFVLDHVDGDADNNRRDNLRLVCPNCDSQLPTYKSRNRGRGRHLRRQRYADGSSY